MIPILYDKNETDFTHNGIGFLSDTIKATITEERNGSYELSLQYPISGIWYDQISRGSIIKAKANDTSAPQLFRVYKASRPLSGIVTYSAEHISYALNGIPTCGLSVKNVTPQAAINKAIEGAALPCPFTALSDISTLNSTEINEPCSVRAILGGQRGSILDVWGGEYEFDNFVVRLHNHRGADNGATIEYGKNLTDITQEENIAECYTHLMPYASYTKDSQNGDEGEEVYVYLSEKVIPLTGAEDIGHSKAYIMDFTDRFGDDEDITEKALREKATAYIATAELGVPKVSISVSFVPLWQTEEYKNIAPLERVSLCDTVRVYFSKLGVTATAKVNKTVYDSLNERYDNIYIGDAKSSFADTVNKTNSEIEDVRQSVKTGQAKAAETFQKEIERATNAITGYSGGYIRLNPPENPQELLVLDKPKIEDALNLWRFNLGGLGHSSTGYNGKYGTAITMDGRINADFLTAGTITGVDIRGVNIYGTNIEGGTIKGSTIEIGDNFSVNEKGIMIAKAGTVGGWDIASTTISQTYTTDDGTVYKVYLANYLNQSPTSRFIHCSVNGTDTFSVYRNGQVNATNARISGGKIGGWDITDTTISQSLTTDDGTTYRVYLATYTNPSPTSRIIHCSVNGDDTFSVYRNGQVNASNIQVSGGTIGGWNITDTTISQTYTTDNGITYRVYLATYTNPSPTSRVIYCSIDGDDTFSVYRNGQVNTTRIRTGELLVPDSDLCIYFNNGDHYDKFSREATKFYDIDTDWVTRNVMYTNGALVISANDGENALYLNASTTYAYSDFRIKKRLIVDGTISLNDSLTVNSSSTFKGAITVNYTGGSPLSVTTATGNDVVFYFDNTSRYISLGRKEMILSGIDSASSTRQVIETSGALVLNANNGGNALYFWASTTYVLSNFIIKKNLTVEGTTSLNDSLTVDGSINGLSIALENISFPNIAADNRRVIRASSALVLSANRGNNAMYLQASTIHALSNVSVNGNITVDGNVNGITTTYESIGWTNIGVSVSSRRVMRSSGALVMSANNGANAMYLDASTTYIVGNLTIGGTAKFSSGGAITSDARLKNSIAYLTDDSRYEALFNSLKPASYKYNDGQSGRTHMGFMANDLKEALEEAGFTTKEIAAYVEFPSDMEGLDGYECAIRYNEIIALNTVMIQKCLAKIFELQQKINS